MAKVIERLPTKITTSLNQRRRQSARNPSEIAAGKPAKRIADCNAGTGTANLFRHCQTMQRGVALKLNRYRRYKKMITIIYIDLTSYSAGNNNTMGISLY